MVFSEDSVCKPCSLLKSQSSRSKYSFFFKEKNEKKGKEGRKSVGNLGASTMLVYSLMWSPKERGTEI